MLYQGSNMPLRCDVCGRFISTEDLADGKALRRFLTPDSVGSTEEYETLCETHNWKHKIGKQNAEDSH